MFPKITDPALSNHLHILGRKLGLPIAGTFELTARCNFNCPMCYIRLSQEEVNKRGKELTAQQWIDLAHQAKDMGMITALLTGGEPFVRKDFFEIYHAIKAMGVLVSINSNGSMLQSNVLKELLEDPPQSINISLYGGSSETYCRMCGLDAFDLVLENIRALKKADVDIRLNVSVTPYNKQDLERIYQISTELDVYAKATSYMYPSIRVNDNQYGHGNRLNPMDAAACALDWDQLRMSKEVYKHRVQALCNRETTGLKECSTDPNDGMFCRAGTSSFWINWDGTMVPCGMMPTPVSHPLETGFAAAWETIRAETAAIRLPKECGVCPNRKMCAVCAAICITETGSFDHRPDYLCRMTEETIRQALERSNMV